MAYWDRPTLKLRAKGVLHTSYWTSFIVALIVSFTGGLLNVTYNVSSGDWEQIRRYSYYYFDQVPSIVYRSIFGIGLVTTILGFAVSAFVSNIFEIGKNRHFTLCRYGVIRIDDVLQGFRGGYYLSNVKTMFLRNLYTFLWSLLFIIPGIIKYYSYFMVAYILAENPGISTERAFEISMKTTEGEKLEMFIMDLSFIGWYLLGTITCGIGVLFVNPYFEATRAELYGALRNKAIQLGIANRDEIGADL